MVRGLYGDSFKRRIHISRKAGRSQYCPSIRDTEAIPVRRQKILKGGRITCKQGSLGSRGTVPSAELLNPKVPSCVGNEALRENGSCIKSDSLFLLEALKLTIFKLIDVEKGTFTTGL
jgi:hypothetical protein